MKINPRNFYKRKLEFIPPYFTTTNVKFISEPQQEILARWLYKNCNGRFAISNTTDYQNDQVKMHTTIGFEEPSDLTLFALIGLTQIKAIQ